MGNTRIQSGKAGTYRELRVNPGADFEKFIQSFYTPRGRGYNFDIEITLGKDGAYDINDVVSGNQILFSSFFQREMSSVSLLHKDGKVYLKCNKCNDTSQGFCKHQKAIFLSLSCMQYSSAPFLQIPNSFDMPTQEAAKSIGLDWRDFNTYYKVIYTPASGGLFFHATDKRLVSTEWMSNIATKYLSTNTSYPSDSRDLTLQKLEEGRHELSAFVWGRHPQNPGLPKLQFLRGYSMKTKPGLHTSNRSLHSLPIGMDRHIQEVAEELLEIEREANNIIKFDRFTEVVNTHIETLNEISQYVVLNDYQFDSNYKTSHQLKFSEETLKTHVTLTEEGPFLLLKCTFTLKGQKWEGFNSDTYITDFFFADNYKIFLYSFYKQNELYTSLGKKGEMLIPRGANIYKLYQLLDALPPEVSIDIAPHLLFPEKVVENPNYSVYLTEVNNVIVFDPQIIFEQDVFRLDGKGIYTDDFHLKVKEEDRDFLLEFMQDSHPSFKEVDPETGTYKLEFSELMNKSWFLHFAESCKTNGIDLLGTDSFKKFKYNTNFAKINTSISSGIDWFDVEVDVQFGDEVVSTKKWVQAIRGGYNYVVLKDGSMGLLPEEWVEKMSQILSVAELQKDKLAIAKLRYNILDDLFDHQALSNIDQEVSLLRNRMQNYQSGIVYHLSDRVQATLRDYQNAGFQWLKFLEQTQTGGILADEMGLGKTLQAIALLAEHTTGTSLVVAPRSLLSNWGREIEKFCPSLKYYILHGLNRVQSVDDLAAYDVVITTYSTAARDIEWLHTFQFNIVILDESQAIKNIASQRYKAVCLLRGNTKLAMTGTPIENNTFDLYAQMSFACPGLLGSAARFKDDFTTPIDQNGDKDKAKLLTKLVHPFMLRRTKDQVAKDLPSRTETVVYCEMDDTQRKLYDNLKNSIRTDLLNNVGNEGWKKSQFKVLEGLLRLRQMCNSPLLVNPGFKGKNKTSVKIDYLMTTIKEELGNHSALIFSQFTSMLALLRAELDAAKIPYAYLDGSTTNRQAAVDYFEQDPNCKLFLLSLKAGNSGLNLTKADYVYLIDPWWNPAVEAQAIDRTHRIGQDKPVFAYRLICKDTLEEKILTLQSKKKALANDLIQTDEGMFKNLSKDEVMNLFE